MLTDVSQPAEQSYPGAALGLPESGRGSLAGWGQRVTALVLDWAASMTVAVLLFGTGVLTGGGWKAWMVLAVFFVESAVLGGLLGSSFGQVIIRIRVFSLDGRPLGWWRAILRAAMICLVVPTVVVGPDRRALNDLMLGTFVGNLR